MAHRNLKFLKDRYLIEDIQLNNDDESLEELHRRYKNMYYKQAHKFKNFFNINNINLDEILKDSYYMIYDSAKTFDYNKKIIEFDIKLSAIPVKIAMKLQIIENFHIKLPHLYFYFFGEVFQLLLIWPNLI